MITKNQNYTAVANGTNKILSMSQQHAEGLAEVLMVIQACSNSMAEQNIREMTKMLKSSKFSKHGVKHICEMIERDLDKMTKIMSSVFGSMTPDERDMRYGDEVVQAMADCLDKSDEYLEPIVKRLDKFIEDHTPKGGECCPEDPSLYKAMLKAELVATMTVDCFENNCRISPCFANAKFSVVLNYKTIMARMLSVRRKINMNNKFGRKLTLNLDGIITHKDLIGKINDRGVFEGGILTDYRDTLYSTEYIDALFIARDGKDPNYRSICESLVEGANGKRGFL